MYIHLNSMNRLFSKGGKKMHFLKVDFFVI